MRMCAAARSTPWPDRRDLPVLDQDDIGTEPTELASFSFGQSTMPFLRPLPGKPMDAGFIVKPHPRIHTPTPGPSTESKRAPMIAPPRPATRAVALGLSIGLCLGHAILGAAWHFFL